MRLRAFFFILLFSVSISAQNLVKNPSFEEYLICPDATEQFDGYVVGWTNFFGTPDYQNVCDYIPDFSISGIAPRTGDAYVSVIWYNHNGTNVPREYIQGELTTELITGESYYFEFYTYPFDYSIGANQHSAHFSQELITETPNTTELSTFYLDLELHIQNTDSIHTELTWIKTSGCYTATGGEKYVTLGNFVSNEETDTIYINPNGQVQYLLVDDVSMYSLSSLVPSDTTVFESTSVSLPTFAGQSYQYQGEVIGNSFSSDVAGFYLIDVYLEDCGYIGSFEIEVFDCTDLENAYERVANDTTVCLEDSPAIPLNAADGLEYFNAEGDMLTEFFTIPDTGTYFIYIGIENCAIVDSFRVVSEFCEIELPLNEINDCFYVPTAFSPNYDGYNDVFKIYGNCEIQTYELSVFDRWGNYLFTTSDVSQGWSGEFREKVMDTGVYVYSILVSYTNSEGIPSSISLSGEVYLMR